MKGTDDYTLTLEDLNEKFGLEAVNLRLANRLTKLWNKIEIQHLELYQRSTAANNNGLRDHYWWPRAGRVASLDPPEPLYTR